MSSFNANNYLNQFAQGGNSMSFPWTNNQSSGGFTPTGPNFGQMQKNVDKAVGQFKNNTQNRYRSGFQPYHTSGNDVLPNIGPGLRGDRGGDRRTYNPVNRRGINEAAWNSLFSQAVFGDMQNQQGIMDEQFNRQNQAIGNYQQAFSQGADQMEGLAARQRETMSGQAQQAQALGKEMADQGLSDFTKFRDAQIGRVDQDIATANQQAAGAVSSFEDTMGSYKDRTAIQASNLAVGLQRQVENTMKDISMGMNPDGTMMDPAQKAALMTTMQQQTAEQTSIGINQIYTQYNDTMASMGANLASLKQAQSQTTLAGGQLRGQVGTAFGAQTIDAQRSAQQIRGSMMELSANLMSSMEQMAAASELGAINLRVGGYKDMYEMISGNKRGQTSMYAALSGWLAAMTTPGLNQIAPPNFGSL